MSSDQSNSLEGELNDMRIQSAESEPLYPPERTYPSHYISTHAVEYKQIEALWKRFQAWIEREEATEFLQLNVTPAPASKLIPIMEELGQGDDTFTLPDEVLASFALHDGQEWEACGLLGRWYLLDCQTMFTEWRDQKEMMEMGLYNGSRYMNMKKAQPKHSRIDTSYWFNPRWIPLACARGHNLGGDLICVDMAPLLAKDQGQIIMYFTETAERIVLANSLTEWLEKIVGHLEMGVYKFDTTRKTYVAGKEPKKEEDAKQPSASSIAVSASLSSSAGANAGPHPTIGVEAFMYSALECNTHFIDNQTEALVYLAEDDLRLLCTEGLGNELNGLSAEELSAAVQEALGTNF